MVSKQIAVVMKNRMNMDTGVERPGRTENGGKTEFDQVLDALADERWDFRTAEGVSKETGIALEHVREVLDGHPESIRKSAVPNRKGRVLYKLKSRGTGLLEFLATVRAFVSKST